jgi:hypothetical protein
MFLPHHWAQGFRW